MLLGHESIATEIKLKSAPMQIFAVSMNSVATLELSGK